MTAGWHAITRGNASGAREDGVTCHPRGGCTCLPFVTPLQPSAMQNPKRCSRCSRRKKKFIAASAESRIARVIPLKHTQRHARGVRAHLAQSARANRLFRTRGLSGSSGLQDIAAETRKRVNALTLSLASIRLVRHRINGTPQFPSTLPPPSANRTRRPR